MCERWRFVCKLVIILVVFCAIGVQNVRADDILTVDNTEDNIIVNENELIDSELAWKESILINDNYSNDTGVESEQESNDTVATANYIKLDTRCNGIISKYNDVDYYKFTLNSAGMVTFSFGHDYVESSAKCWGLEVFSVYNTDDSLKAVTYAGNVYGTETSCGLGLPTGDYIIRINSFQYNLDKPYYFAVNYEKSDVWEKENNNTTNTATEINENTVYNGSVAYSDDVDNYTFSIHDPGVITITFGHEYIDSSGTYWVLNVYSTNNMDDSLKEIRYAGNVKNDITSPGLGLPAGEYVIRIARYGFNHSDNPYHFSVNYRKSDVWEKENNNTTNTATEINENTVYDGSVAYSNDVDNYTFSLNDAGVITITFGHEYIDSSNTYWVLNVYNTNDMDDSLKEIRYAGNVKSDITSPGLGVPAGEYVIRIARYGFNHSDNPYHFSANYRKSDVWEKENNNATNTATAITVNTKYNGSLSNYADLDNYKFNMSNEGLVTFTFGHEYVDSSNAYWKLNVYNSNNMNSSLKEIRYVGNVTVKEETEGITLPAGEYIIRIGVYNSAFYSDLSYHFSVNDPNAVVIIKKGDMTGDGEIAMGDVVKLARAVAGNVTLTASELKAADVTGDGEVAMGDVLKIAKYVAGTINEF